MTTRTPPRGPRTRRDERYPPHVLREYALLADGERGVLVGPKGDYTWMCFPRWDSDAVFSALIGGAGLYAITPEDPRFVWGGYYEPGSLIWHSRWITPSATIECREALAYPGDSHTAVLLRRIIACDGAARVDVVLDARAGFGAHQMTGLTRDRRRWIARSGDLHLRWSGAHDARAIDEGGLALRVTLNAGEHHDLVLELSDRPVGGDPIDPDRAWAATSDAWRTSVPQFEGTLAPREVRDSYALLRGLTSAGGGMVAAATMSLPERAGAGRSYDYRYVWIRDQSYVGQAIAAHGAHELLDDAVSFVSERIAADGEHLKPAYTTVGGDVPDERRLTRLCGYPGGADKIGNWVNKQFQLDILGESLLLFSAADRLGHLDTEHWRNVEVVVKAIAERWQSADAGIWELDDNRWAHSRLTCVAGLRAISASASHGAAGAWSSLADAILADVSADCVHASGRWMRAPDDERTDAALLLPTIRGALRFDDPRAIATLEAVELELGGSGYAYRFRHDARPLEDAEGAFVLCGFVMALALHQQGRTTDAIAWFERNKAACGPPGLYSEEFDVTQRQLRGNIPQAFVHALMFEAATRLRAPWGTL